MSCVLLMDRNMLFSTTNSNLNIICILGGIHGPKVSMHQVSLALMVASREGTRAKIAHGDEWAHVPWDQ